MDGPFATYLLIYKNFTENCAIKGPSVCQEENYFDLLISTLTYQVARNYRSGKLVGDPILNINLMETIHL